MRRITLAIIMVAAVFAAQAQDDNISLEGSGKIITKNVDVKSFNGIQVKGISRCRVRKSDGLAAEST